MTQQRSTGSFLTVSLLATPGGGWGEPLESCARSAQHSKLLSSQARVTAVEEANTHLWSVRDRSKPGTIPVNPIPSLTTVRSGYVIERDGVSSTLGLGAGTLA